MHFLEIGLGAKDEPASKSYGVYNLLVISSGGNSSCIPRLTKSQAQELSRGFEDVDEAV